MNIIAVINEKGGVAKTTTAVNLAYGLARANDRVLLLDMDPQSNATTAVGLEPSDFATRHIGEALIIEDPDFSPFVVPMPQHNLWMIPASRTLRDTADELMDQGDPLERLTQGLHNLQAYFDYVVIDLPPTIEVLQEMAIEASDYFLLPVELSRFAVDGVTNLVEHLVNRRQGTPWDFRILLSRVEGFNKQGNDLAFQSLRDLDPYILETTIRYNGKIPMSQDAGQDIYSFAPLSRGARDFRKLAKEIRTLWPKKALQKT